MRTPLAKGLSGSALKTIAVICMTADHLAWTLCPGYDRTPWVIAVHLLGRTAAPILWFFIAEGAHYTHDVRRYTARLFALAAVSHFAYCFCFDLSFLPFRDGWLNQTGVVWTLALGLVLIRIDKSSRFLPRQKTALTLLAGLAALPADWSCTGCMAILFLSKNRGDFRRQAACIALWTSVYAAVFFLFQDRIYGALQMGVVLSLPLLRLYNGQKGGRRGTQPFFYIYYPLHLALLGVLRLALQR